MKLSGFAKQYKNKSLSLFLYSLISISISPLILYTSIPSFSGFGFFQINADYILKIYAISKYLLFFGFLIPTSILVCSIICGLNRKLISLIFPILVNFTIYGLVIYLIITGILTIITIFFFFNEIQAMSFIPIAAGYCLILAIFVAIFPIVKGIKHFIKKNYIKVIGIRLNKKNHKTLFDYILNICKKIKSDPPHNIIVGLTTDFYAVSNDVKLFDGNGSRIVKNKTIYISLPFLRILTTNELASLIGHEAGHFVGKDTYYASKFSPIYRRLNNQFISLEKNEKKLFDYIGIYPIIFLYNEFTRKNEKINKIREYKADEFGASAVDGKTLMCAIAKLYIYDWVWEETEENHREIVRDKIKSNIKNLSKNFVKLARNDIDKTKLKKVLNLMLKYEQKHPNDTHPPLLERMKNVKVKESDITNQKLLNFLPSAASLIANIEAIEEHLSEFLTKFEEYKNKN